MQCMLTMIGSMGLESKDGGTKKESLGFVLEQMIYKETKLENVQRFKI